MYLPILTKKYFKTVNIFNESSFIDQGTADISA